MLINASAAQQTTAVHANLHALFRALAALPGGALVETETLSYHHAPFSNPFFRGVWRTRLPATAVDDAITAATAWFRQRGAADFFWWTDPDTAPPDLTARLLARGFDGNEAGDPGMVVALDDLDTAVFPPTGFKIVTAVTDEALAHWRDVFVAAYGMPAAAGQAWVEATIAAGRAQAPWQLYVGYLQGEPVATAMGFCGAGVAGIYSVGTVPAARGQGIGTFMTRQPLLAARTQGYRYGVLFASRMAYSLYRRLGFRDTNGRIGLVVWEND